MARGRMISKTLSTSERRAALHQEAPDLAEFCQALYPLLVAHSDDSGRQQGDAFTVKHAVDPSSPRSLRDFERALEAMATVGLLDWYTVDGRKYLEIRDFAPHQPGLKNRGTSKIPAAIPPLPGNAVECREVPSELKRTELNGTEEKGTEPPAPPAVSPARPQRSGPARGLLKPHGNVYFEGPRVYVPWPVHHKLQRLRNHPNAQAELDALYQRVSEDWTFGARKADEPGADMFRFWEARYNEQWPPTAAVVKTAAPITADELQRKHNTKKYSGTAPAVNS